MQTGKLPPGSEQLSDIAVGIRGELKDSTSVWLNYVEEAERQVLDGNAEFASMQMPQQVYMLLVDRLENIDGFKFDAGAKTKTSMKA
ncbi:hypothetical protein PHYPSEUDO_001470 [Phytophthora pseudosyringae]|uniref:Uncharacterized protein n=1 Tax=Phytophthora pseudosyringae TaxID=221518 RepID=A0A8T1V295_9STRA|nr:hypothetical protein PHYPSEUDO_001470 [Phytophthora pseudosyringae]